MRRLAPITALLGVLLPAVAAAHTGPPDRFGYTWIDQDEPGVRLDVPFATGGPFPITLKPNKLSAPIPFGFNFPFYGQSYASFVVSEDGWISFDTTLTSTSALALPMPLAPPPNALVAFYWTDLDTPRGLVYQTFPAGLAVTVLASSVSGATNVTANIVFYRSGVIKINYNGVTQPELAGVGIENAAGDDGQNPWYRGTGQNGFQVRDGAVLVFLPPVKLACAPPTTIGCNQTVRLSNAGLPASVDDYLCGNQAYLGSEKVVQFTNPILQDVTASISNLAAGIDLDVLFLQGPACREFGCLAGGSDSAYSSFLPAGDYLIAVDGKTPADAGTFDLTVTCTPKMAVLPCGSPPVRGQTTGSSHWSQWCGYPGPGSLDGPEFIYQVPLTMPGNLRVTLTPDPGIQQDLLAFGPDVFPDPTVCLQYADSIISLRDPPLGNYYFVVEGRSTATEANIGAFTIKLECDIFRLDCSRPQGDLACFQASSGTTVGAVDHNQVYGCSADVFPGGEAVFRFHNDVRRTVSFLYSGPPTLTLLLVRGSCDEKTCLAQGDGGLIAEDLDVGDYFLIVDSRSGAGAFSVTPVCGNVLDPPSGTFSIGAGQSVHEAKTAWVTAEPTRADVLYALDLTASQETALENLKATARAAASGLGTSVADVEVGLATFEDYPKAFDSCGYGPLAYGGSQELPYRLDLPLTADTVALDSTLQGLRIKAGGDAPESYLRVWHEAVADTVGIGWRKSSRHILIMTGDDEPHSCDADACGTPRSSTGVDPGPDAVAGTADDLDLKTEMRALRGAGIYPLFLFTGNSARPDILAEWSCWTGLGGGQAYDAPSGAQPPALVNDLVRHVESNTLRCDRLELRGSPGFEAWVKSVTPPSAAVTLPVRVGFDVELSPPAGTPPGTYKFTVEMVCDGEVKASQDVTVDVTGSCLPAGRIGNALRAVKRGGDVELTWRTAPLAPRSYNVHRFAAKTALPVAPLPPAGAPLGPASGDELYTDAAVAGNSLYQAFGRDCMGNSVGE